MRAALGLTELLVAGVGTVPHPVGAGTVGSTVWTAESALPGGRPRALTPTVLDDVCALLGQLPRNGDPPSAPVDDLRAVTAAVPSRSSALERLTAEIASLLPGLPSTMRHGDLWTGNLLVHGGRLSGLVDWDAWHPRSVPGTDLLQLLVTFERHRRGVSLGEAWIEQPWRRGPSAGPLRAQLRKFGVPASDDDVVGLAWWAGEAAGTLSRSPALGEDVAWVSRNIDPVLPA